MQRTVLYKRPALALQAFALAMVALATAVGWWAGPRLDAVSIFALFYLAVILSSWFAGFRPGVAACLLGGLCLRFFLLEPRFSLSMTKPQQGTAFGLFFVISFLTCCLHEMRRRSLRLHEANEEQLRHQRQWYERMLSSISHGVVAVNGKGRIDFINAAGSQLCGWTEQEVQGRELSAVLHLEEESGRVMEVDRLWNASVAQETCAPLEAILKGRTGGRLVVEIRSSPIPGVGAGAEAGTLLVFQDITQKRQAERELQEKEERFRTMADSAPVLIWIADIHGRATFFNKPWLKFTGLTLEQSQTQDWADCIHPSDVSHWLEVYREAFRHRESFTLEYRLRRADGQYRWMLDTGVPRLSIEGQFMGYAGSSIDITERRQEEKSNRFLLAASGALSASLDYEATIQTVASLAVPEFADWCAVDLATPQGVRRLAVGHVDPAKVVLALKIGQRHPPDLSGMSGVARVLRSGQAERVPLLEDEDLAVEARNEEHLEQLRELGMKSYICVPLRTWDRVIGVISFVINEAGRQYSSHDLRLAEELARRAALAVDNSRLYFEAREAIKRKDEVLAQLDTLLATAPVGLAFWDAEQRYLRINQAYASMNGVPEAELLGRSLEEMAPEVAARVGPILSQVLESGRPLLEVDLHPIQRMDPEDPREFLASYFPVSTRSGNTLGVGVVVVDITERRRSELAMRESERQEQLLNVERAARAQLETANHALATSEARYRDVNAELESFSYSISHDLRTPLRGMRTLSHALLEDHHDKLDEEGRMLIERINKGAMRMDALIRDLLAYSRLSRSELVLAEVSLEILVAEVLEEHHDLVSQHQAQVTVEGPLPSVRAHYLALFQAVSNLAGNALKFFSPARRPQLRLRSEERGEWIRLWVEDNGIGIAPQHFERIYKVFERLHGEEEYSGTGIGLAITRKAVERMGGRVGLASQLGQGSSFWVELPKAR